MQIVTTSRTWQQAIEGWQADADFRAECSAAIADCPHAAVFWETPPVQRDTLDQPFEFALLPAPALARMRANPGPFAEHIGSGRGAEEVRVFDNLGGDAVLVAPCAAGPAEHYTHLASFVRHAPARQVERLWQAVGRALEARLGETAEKVWVSTSGLGVGWVHVRLDRMPKYYTHAPYREAR